MRIAVNLITLRVFTISLGGQANPITSESIASPLPPPSQREVTQVPISIPTPADARLQILIEKAKEDLAQRLSILTPQISLVDFMDVEWSDSSLGYPQPGMVFPQVITPGYLIRLRALDRVFEFHTDKGDQIIHWDDPSAPLPGTLPYR